MKPVFCPHLGLLDDAETRVGFPSPRNYCWRSRPIEIVSLEHQSSTCLNEAHSRCPVLLNNVYTSLPDNLRLDQKAGKKKQLGITISIAVMAFIFILAVVWWQGGFLARSAAPMNNGNGSGPGLNFPITSEQSLDGLYSSPTLRPSDQSTVQSTTGPSDMTFSSDTPLAKTQPSDVYETGTASSTFTVSPCSSPAGWVIYLVQPGDSLFHIGLEFGVTVSELQSANCMGNAVTIFAGQKLYVPNTPSRTRPRPFTPTPMTVIPSATHISPSDVILTVISTSILFPTETPGPTNTPVTMSTPTGLPTATLTPPPPADILSR